MFQLCWNLIRSWFQRVTALSEEIQESQEIKRKLVYTFFIKVYLSRQNSPGKNLQDTENLEFYNWENKNILRLFIDY